MKSLIIYKKILERINKFNLNISYVLVLGMVAITVLNVLGRKFYIPINGSYEIIYLSLALIVILNLGYTQLKNGHIHIDIFVERIKNVKIRSYINIFGYVLSILFVSFLIIGVLRYSLATKLVKIEELNLSQSLFFLLIIYGLTCYLVNLFYVLLKYIASKRVEQ